MDLDLLMHVHAIQKTFETCIDKVSAGTGKNFFLVATHVALDPATWFHDLLPPRQCNASMKKKSPSHGLGLIKLICWVSMDGDTEVLQQLDGLY